MPYIDQITRGETTYDIQDSETKAVAETLSGEVADLKSAIVGSAYTEKVNTGIWEVGSYYYSSGAKYGSDKRLRMTTYISLADGIICVSSESGYEFAVYAWEKDSGNYVGVLLTDGTFATSGTAAWLTSYSLTNAEYKFRFVLRHAEATMDISESVNLLFVSQKVDDMLSTYGFAADANAVGTLAHGPLLDSYFIDMGAWSLGFLNGNGTIDKSEYAVSTDYISIEPQYSLKYCGETVINGIQMYCYVSEYDSNYNHIGRTLVYGSNGLNILKTNTDTKYIKVCFGNTSSYGRKINNGWGKYCKIISSKLLVDTTYLERMANVYGLHSTPESVGVLNVIKRARQLTDIKWTPKNDLPRICSVEDGSDLKFYRDVFLKDVEYTGIPYSETWGLTGYGYQNQYVGYSVPFSAYATAMDDENSVIYTNSVVNVQNHRSIYFGTVCSALVNYALGRKYYSTSQIPTSSGIVKITDVAGMDVDVVKLGDIVNRMNDHTAIITDIVRDANGNTTLIEISEATTKGNGNYVVTGGQYGGVCRRIAYTPSDFLGRFGLSGWELLRYTNIDLVGYEPDLYANIQGEPGRRATHNLPCIPFMGEGYAYKLGHIPNKKILINNTNYTKLTVVKDGTVLNTYAVDETTEYVELDFDSVGVYEAYLSGEDASASKTFSCHWTIES